MANVRVLMAAMRVGPGVLGMWRAALLLVVHAAGVAAAVVHETAGDAYRRGDYAKAVSIIERPAAMGDIDAQIMLGQMYLKGQGVPASPEKAVSWIGKAADQGSMIAEYTMGVLATAGIGGPPDSRAAAAWFRKAAHQQYADAAYNLAVLYQRGEGVDQNAGLALNWIGAALQFLPYGAAAASRSKFEATRSAILAGMTADEVAAAGHLESPDGPVVAATLRDVAAFQKSMTYPLGMRGIGAQGSVLLLVLVSAEGRVLNELIETSSGYPKLDDVVLKALPGAEILPKIVEGKPIEGWQFLKWTFVLR